MHSVASSTVDMVTKPKPRERAVCGGRDERSEAEEKRKCRREANEDQLRFVTLALHSDEATRISPATTSRQSFRHSPSGQTR